MRYTRISIGSWIVALLLAAVAFAAAWVRARERAAPEAAVDLAAMGRRVWNAECRSCHGEGEAPSRSIPPMRGFAVELFVSPGGREYLIDFLFNGEVRRVEKGVVSYEPGHPPFDHLGNAEAAAVLNHMLTRWGNAELVPEGERLYSIDEIAARR